MGCFGSKPYTAPQPVASQWYPAFEARLPSMAGRAVAVTGCTTGTGFACARACARKGAHVLLLNRPSERATAAAQKIAAEVQGGGKVTSVDCDLTDFGSVKKAAAEMASALGGGGLDVLCNNAGVMALADEATKDGYDVQMQTNHLSHFMLSKEAFPLLEKAGELRGEARIVNHSSLARMGPRLEPKYLGKNGGNLGGNGASMFLNGARWVRYHHTKLANAVFTLALQDRLTARGSKVKAVCAAPGLAATNLQVTTHVRGGMKETWIMRFAQSAEDGAMPLLQCVAGAGVPGGTFIEPTKMMGGKGPPAPKALDPATSDAASREMLWKQSEAACGAWAL